jgi:hypothetical protein
MIRDKIVLARETAVVIDCFCSVVRAPVHGNACSTVDASRYPACFPASCFGGMSAWEGYLRDVVGHSRWGLCVCVVVDYVRTLSCVDTLTGLCVYPCLSLSSGHFVCCLCVCVCSVGVCMSWQSDHLTRRFGSTAERSWSI